MNHQAFVEYSSVWDRAGSELLNAEQLRSGLEYYGEETYYASKRLHLLGWPAQAGLLVKACYSLNNVLRNFDIGLYRKAGFNNDIRLPGFKLPLGDTEISVDYLAAGNFGMAFKLSKENAAPIVLKVFYRRYSDHHLNSGPYAETALGLYITKQNVCNMPHLLAADPKNAWFITEYVDSNFTPMVNSGVTWQNLGFKLCDAIDSNQIINQDGQGIRIDYGHLTHDSRIPCKSYPTEIFDAIVARSRKKTYLTAERFLDLYDRFPKYRQTLAEELALVAADQRMQALRGIFFSPEFEYFPVIDYFLQSILPTSDFTEVFALYRQHTNPLFRAQAIFNLDKLSVKARLAVEEVWDQFAEFVFFNIYAHPERFNRTKVLKSLLMKINSERK